MHNPHCTTCLCLCLTTCVSVLFYYLFYLLSIIYGPLSINDENKSLYLAKDTRYRHSYYERRIGTRMRSIKWSHFQWPWTNPNSVFKVTPLFDAQYLTNGYIYGHSVSKLLEHVGLLIELYEDQLGSDHLQFGFKKEHGCVHALFTFKETIKYFILK